MIANLTSTSPFSKRCERCDINLASSKFDGQPVAVEFVKRKPKLNGNKIIAKYHCIKCHIMFNHITEEQLKEFLGLKKPLEVEN